jgi:hypothetical protein
LNKLIPTLTLGLLLLGCEAIPVLPSTPSDKQHFKQAVLVNDQPTNPMVTFSTINGLQHRENSHPVVLNDNFLRGTLDKVTGRKMYQVYNVIYYAGTGAEARWKYFERVRYQTEQRENIATVQLVKKNEDCSALSLYGQCLYHEQVVFPLEAAEMKTLASSYLPGEQKPWLYELVAKSGEVYKDQLLLAEIVGLMEKMDEYTTPHTNFAYKQEQVVDPLIFPESAIELTPAQELLPILQ